MFESEFLRPTEDSKEAYRRLIGEAAELVRTSFPDHPYAGKSPQALLETISSEVLPSKQSSWEQITPTLCAVISNSVAVSNPFTAAHLHCPPLLAALAAEVVISAMNQSMDSFDQAPVASVMEQKMIRWLCAEAGFPKTAEGTFTTGGSQSNYLALLLAREACFEKRWNCSVKKSGLPTEARDVRILCSEVAHFSVEKSASQLGLGSDSVVRIAVDNHFRMDPSALREALDSLTAQSLLPMAIVATAGTTDFGSIDPLQEIAFIARQADVWLHVDAAYGGALLFSPQHREKLAGIETADSIAIDFHKLFWQPIPCSAFLLHDVRHFDAIKLYADYLNPEFQEEKGIPNLVTTSLLTSRRFDALKLWISLQSLGREKLAAMIERTIGLADYAANLIRADDVLQLICEPQLSTVVFRYIVRTQDSNMDQINAEVRESLFHRGVAVVGHTRVRGQRCLKLTCMNPATSEADLEGLIALIRSEGEKSAARSDP